VDEKTRQLTPAIPTANQGKPRVWNVPGRKDHKHGFDGEVRERVPNFAERSQLPGSTEVSVAAPPPRRLPLHGMMFR
jgi:hypothetical protein